MPEIIPNTLKDALSFISKNKQEIINGVYDLKIKEEWIRAIDDQTLSFLAKYCLSSAMVLSSSNITPKHILEELSKKDEDDIEINENIAGNLNTPLSTLKSLASHYLPSVREKVAANPNTPTEALINLSKDSKTEIREKVAANPNTPTEILINLSKDNFSSVKAIVAANPNTPVEILSEFSKDSYYRIREGIAKNINTPPNILKVLSMDSDNSIRKAVAENLNTPVDVLKTLKEDEWSSVSSAAWNNPNCPKPVRCFIATAVYGSPISNQVSILIKFRDTLLIKNYFGRLFIYFYNFVSPSIARIIAESEFLKSTIRCFLKPVITVIKKINENQNLFLK